MRIARILAMVALCLASRDTRLATTDSSAQTYQVTVNSILAFITAKQSPTAGTGITDWENANNTYDKTDCVAIFRLVTNKSATIDTTTTQANQILTNSATSEQLPTFYNLNSDGDGTSTTGFASGQYGNGIGPKSGSSMTNFQYVGGGNATWASDNGYTAAQFLSAGKTLTRINKDGAALLTLTVRGLNGEDFGNASDNTEAPEVGTYTVSFTLRATAIP
ncbi:hypothetical protein FJZ36_09445 [Candidatus Poribacteria bacterium]|nr:hypothetical protein [Candidatus Poribacteria bacterium]